MTTYVTPLQKSTTVQIVYDDVPGLVLPLPDGERKRVDAMSPEEFLDALELLMVPVDAQYKAPTRKILYDLDYSERLDRWYALDELVRVGARLPDREVAA